MHKVIDTWARNGFPTRYIEQATVNTFKQEASGIVFASKQPYYEMMRKALRGALLTERIYRLLHFPEHQARIEYWFNVPFPDRPQDRLIGGMDVDDPETCSVYDLKLYSDQDHSDRRQVLTYTIVKEAQGQPVKQAGFITPFLSRKVTTVAVTPEELAAHKYLMTSALVEMEKGIDAEPHQGSWCFFCDYRGTAHCSMTFRPGILLG